MAESIIVEGVDPLAEEVKVLRPTDEAVTWVMGHVDPWRKIRDTHHKPQWDNWFSIWMGKWKTNMKTRKSERSRIISPGSQMAVDLTVAEIVEGTFAHRLFFGLSDDASDEERRKAGDARGRLVQDLYDAGIIDAFTEATLNGALYGTGILKIAMDVELKKSIDRVEVDADSTGRASGRTKLVAVEDEVVTFSPVAIEPGQFVPDPSSTDIDKMLGCAHEFRMPLHTISARQREGVYFADEVAAAPTGTEEDSSTAERRNTPNDSPNNQWANITEWHGLIPAGILIKIQLQKSGNQEAADAVTTDDGELVESIVTIANGGILLRAIPAPTLLKDRAIVSWQHDKIPNSFWGRGVMQKGSNIQAAVDAEMRARVDNLAWSSNPMLAVKASALMPGQNMNIWPGKVWAMREDTQNSLREFKFGEIGGSSFQQTQELSTWMSQATGTVDTVAARQNVRDEATGAAAIQQSGFLKRARHTMYNIEGAMTKFIRRMHWRKMQYDPDRYNGDFEFIVEGTSGLMAREMERQQHISSMQFLEQGSPEQLFVLKKVFENDTADSKAEIIALLDKKMEGPSEAEQKAKADAEAAALESVKLANAKLVAETLESRAKTLKLAADAGLAGAKEALTVIQAQVEEDSKIFLAANLQVDQQEVMNHIRQLDISEDGNDIRRESLKIQARKQFQGAAS